MTKSKQRVKRKGSITVTPIDNVEINLDRESALSNNNISTLALDTPELDKANIEETILANQDDISELKISNTTNSDESKKSSADPIIIAPTDLSDSTNKKESAIEDIDTISELLPINITQSGEVSISDTTENIASNQSSDGELEKSIPNNTDIAIETLQNEAIVTKPKTTLKRKGNITITPSNESDIDNISSISNSQNDVIPELLPININQSGEVSISDTTENIASNQSSDGELEKSIPNNTDIAIEALQNEAIVTKPKTTLKRVGSITTNPKPSYPVITDDTLPLLQEVDNYNSSHESMPWGTLALVGGTTAIITTIVATIVGAKFSNRAMNGQELLDAVNGQVNLANTFFNKHGTNWIFKSRTTLELIDDIGKKRSENLANLASSIIYKALKSIGLPVGLPVGLAAGLAADIIADIITVKYIEICNFLSNTPAQKLYDFESIVINHEIAKNNKKSNIEQNAIKKSLDAKGEVGIKLYKTIYEPVIIEKYDLLNKVAKGILTPEKAANLKAKQVKIELENHTYKHCIEAKNNFDKNSQSYKCFNIEDATLDFVTIGSDNSVKVNGIAVEQFEI